jgi:lipoprotein-anchoring transpeptidase ErfK/SrfK
MKQTLILTMTALALTTSVAAQEVMVTHPVAQAPLDKQRVEARAAVESRITTGAPYSAEAVTESLQVLSDGNRIARKTTTRVYRDSEGRTRREQLTSAGTVQSVTISDPVAGSMYVLNPAERTAHRSGVIMAGAGGGFGVASVAPGSSGTVTATRTADGGVRVSASGSNEAGRRRETDAQVAAGGSAGVAGSVTSSAAAGSGGAVPVAGGIAYPPEAMTMPRMVAPGYAGGPVNKEDLGQQVIEGVLATGTRMTTTIPAGSIGNEQPILVVSEQWFSPDLKVLVMTKHSDPRSGENTYRLTNITQTEPARSLFEVPADYTLKDSVIRRQSPMLPQ